MLGNALEDRLRHIVTFEQVAEIQENRRFVGDRVAAEVQTHERTHRLDVVEGFLGARVGEIVPLLQAVDAHHDTERKRPSPALRSHLRIVRLDQRLEQAPRHDSRHLAQEHVPLRPLLLCREIKRRKAQLVGHRCPSNG